MFSSNNDILKTKINIDDLYEKKNKIQDQKERCYKKILARAHTKIKQTARLRAQDEYCFFLVPEFQIGVPSYDTASCIAYIMDKLQKNGFNVKYTHPNLIFISWNHYIDKRQRHEYKKNTGIAIDGFGNQIIAKDNDTNKTNNTPNSFLLNGKNKNTVVRKKDNKQYTQISNYNPTGKLIYNTNLLKKIEDKLI
tara:strand:+ start:3624 stop:4205 length:582 start_codon:yes stop_codon:yes gene_type:complete